METEVRQVGAIKTRYRREEKWRMRLEESEFMLPRGGERKERGHVEARHLSQPEANADTESGDPVIN